MYWKKGKSIQDYLHKDPQFTIKALQQCSKGFCITTDHLDPHGSKVQNFIIHLPKEKETVQEVAAVLVWPSRKEAYKINDRFQSAARAKSLIIITTLRCI